MKESATGEQKLDPPAPEARRGRAESGMQRRERGDLGAFEPGARFAGEADVPLAPEGPPAPEVTTDPEAFIPWTEEELAASGQKPSAKLSKEEEAARAAQEAAAREAARKAEEERAYSARAVARAPEVAAIEARVQKLRDQQGRLRAYIEKVSARVLEIPLAKPDAKPYKRSDDDVIRWYEQYRDRDEERVAHNVQIMKARRQIGRIQREIDALVPQTTIEERRKDTLKDAAQRWADEKAQLENIIRKTNVTEATQSTATLPELKYRAGTIPSSESSTETPTYFYGIHDAAVDRLKVVNKKINALQSRYRWREETGTPAGRLPPTARALRTAVYNAEARQSPSRTKTNMERHPGKVFGDLFEYYNDAVHAVFDPHAVQEDKVRARNNFAYEAYRVARAIERLPTTTLKQQTRKRELGVLIKPFLVDVDEEFEWMSRRLLPVYDALNRCYEARGQLSTYGRSPERIEALRLAVIQFETTFRRCEEEIKASTDNEDEYLKEALSARTIDPAAPQVFYEFKTVSDPTQPFNLVTPFPHKEYKKGMNINLNIDRINDLRSLPYPEEIHNHDEESALQAHNKRVDRVKKQFQGLEDVLHVFKAASKFETENLIYKSQPLAIGAKPEFTLDDIARLREEKGASPTPAIGLKSVTELKRETRAYAEAHAKEERIQTTQKTLCDRLGVKPEQLMNLPAFGIGRRIGEAVRNFWHRRVRKTKDYVSTQDLLAEYRKLRAEAEATLEPEKVRVKQEALTNAVATEVAAEMSAVHRLTKLQELCEVEMNALRSIDSTSQDKLAAISYYQEAQKQYTELRKRVPSHKPIVLSITRILQSFEREIKAYQDRIRLSTADSIENIVRSSDNTPKVVRLREYIETLPILTLEWETRVSSSSVKAYNDARERLDVLSPEHRLTESDYLSLQRALFSEAPENAEKILEKNKKIFLTLPQESRRDYYLSLLTQRKIAALGEVHELEYRFRQLPRAEQAGRRQVRFESDRKKLLQFAIAAIEKTKGNRELLAA